jgi:hypothetical protein
MPYRAMALVAASLLFATQSYAAKNLNTSRSNIYRAGSTISGGHHGSGGGAAGVTQSKPKPKMLNPQPEPPGRR